MNDYAYADRQALIHDLITPEEKLRRAKVTLGDRYVFHISHAVKRAPQKQPEMQRTDVAKTWARVRKTGVLV